MRGLIERTADDRAPCLDLDDDAALPVPFVEDRSTLPAYVVAAGAVRGRAERALAAVTSAACCSPGACGPDARDVPTTTLLLGAPGYAGDWVTEVAGPCGDEVVDVLVDRAVAYAAGIGARVVAAACTSRGGGGRIESRLVELGGTTRECAYEDYVTLDGPAGSFLDTLPPAVLRRRARDLAAAAEAGIVIRPMDAAEVVAHRTRLDDLSAAATAACRQGERAGAGRTGDGALWWGAFAGRELEGYCTALPSGDALWLGPRGVVPDGSVSSAGAYFAMAHHAVVDTAAVLGYRRVEFGAGAHHARLVRGCSSRPVRGCTLVPEVL